MSEKIDEIYIKMCDIIQECNSICDLDVIIKRTNNLNLMAYKRKWDLEDE